MSSVASRLQHPKVETFVTKIIQHVKTRSNRLPRQEFSSGGAYVTWGAAPFPFRPSETEQPLSFPLEVPNFESSRRPLSLVESIYCHLAPREGKYRGKAWIVRAEEVDPTTWFLLNPVSRIDHLLDSTSPIIAHIDNPSDIFISEVARSYTLLDYHGLGEIEIKASKVIPLLSPSQGEVMDKEDLKLLALDWDGKLAFWKHGDEHWTNILSQDSQDGFRFKDIVSHKGKFYATLTDEETAMVYEIDPTNPSIDTECVGSFGLPLNGSHICNVADLNGRLHFLNGNDLDSVTVHVLNECGQLDKHEEITCSNGYTLFMLNEVSFRVPTHLLGRGYDKDWICVSTDDVSGMSSKGFEGGYGGFSASFIGQLWPNHGLNPIEELVYPEYFDCFSKCDLTGNLTSFYSLPDSKYVSLFFPPPPWLDWHALDAVQGNPSIWFTDHLHKYEDALKFDDVDD